MASEKQKKRVLLVEDDGLQRRWLAEDLADAGLEVLEASNADAAMRAMTRATPPVEAVITDIQMPGSTDGIGLARYVLSRWPEIEVIILSGIAEASVPPDRAVMLPKPALARDLVHILNRGKPALI